MGTETRRGTIPSLPCQSKAGQGPSASGSRSTCTCDELSAEFLSVEFLSVGIGFTFSKPRSCSLRNLRSPSPPDRYEHLGARTLDVVERFHVDFLAPICITLRGGT